MVSRDHQCDLTHGINQNISKISIAIYGPSVCHIIYVANLCLKHKIKCHISVLDEILNKHSARASFFWNFGFGFVFVFIVIGFCFRFLDDACNGFVCTMEYIIGYTKTHTHRCHSHKLDISLHLSCQLQ